MFSFRQRIPQEAIPNFYTGFLKQQLKPGATVINIPDAVGYTTPFEFSVLIKNIKEHVSNIDKAEISVHCHNDLLGLAVANTLAGAKARANQLECTINGIGERAGNAALEEIVMAINTRKDFFDLSCNVDTKQIYHTSGKDAQSEVVVKIRRDKRIVMGRGLSTDIVEASILAYLNAANKIMNGGATQEGKNGKENSNF